MRRPVNVLVLTYWSLPDALIQTYTLPYLRIIRKLLPSDSNLFLVTLEKSKAGMKDRSSHEQLRREGITWMPENYRSFGFKALVAWCVLLVKLAFHIRENDIQYIHCWATPAGAAGYLLSIMTGRSLIVDSYEPHAESMVENGTWKRKGLAFQLLFLLERMQTARATILIAANAGMRNYALEKYGVVVQRFFVKPACVNLEAFSMHEVKNKELLQQLGLTDRVVCVYAGKFGGIYLNIEVFKFLVEAHKYWGDQFRVLLLTSHSPEEILEYCHRAGLDPAIVLTRFVPHVEIPKYIGLGDFALSPYNPVPSKRFCTPIKNGEYWALGLPVVITDNISDDSEIIRNTGLGAVLDRLDTRSYQEAIKKVDHLLTLPSEDLRTEVRKLAIHYRNYSIAENVYGQIYPFQKI